MQLLSATRVLFRSVLLFLSTIFYSQVRSDMKFDHISLKDGLSNFTVTAMAQDEQGFLWFGTEDGLNKYDGYTFRQYLFEPSDTTGLPSPNVTSLCVDRMGRVWVGTQNGLAMHDPRINDNGLKIVLTAKPM